MKRFFPATVPLVLLVISLPVPGQVSFFQPPLYSGGGSAQFIADFNGDGKPDILTSDGTMNLGNGDGTFTLGKSVSGTPLAVADFNGDGKPDILEQGTGTLLVLLGNGDGTFQAPISTNSGASLSPVAAVDVNGDHKADVVGVFNGSLYVYISNGDGTVKAGVPYNAGVPSNADAVLSFGDFNSDQKTDIALSISGNNAPGQEIVLLGNGDGTFQQAPKISAGVYIPQFAVVADFNGDGKMDLAVSSLGIPSSSVPPAVYVLLGNGDGTFQTPTLAINTFGPLGVADLNADGNLDLVLAAAPTGVQIYLGNGHGSFTNASNYQLSLPQFVGGGGIGVITVADFNSDGKPDIASSNAILLGNGNGSFQGWPLGVIPGIPGAAVVGRFDKAGAPGVAVVAGTSVHILSNDGSGALSLAHTYTLQQPLGEPLYGLVTADFSGDGNLDLVVIGEDAASSHWSFSVLLGNGDSSFQAPVFYPQSVTPSPNSGLSVVVADFNNDHKPDLAVGGMSNGTLAIFLGNGDGTFASPVFYFDGDYVPPLLVADFNGDGKVDIAAGGTDNSSTPVTTKTAILFGNGDGTFQAASFPSSLNNFLPTLTADVRNAGKADLIGGNQIALGNGDGTFTLLSPLTCPTWFGGMPCEIVALADLNGDRKPDLVIQQGGLQVFQSGIQVGNGDGTFAAAIPFPTNSDLPPVLIADMNGDGRPDLIFMWPPGLSTSPLSGVGVILNTTPPASPDFSIGPASGSQTSQTISAGQTAKFSLAFVGTLGYSGTVNLTCAVTPPVTLPPTCNLSSASVQISGSATQTVTVSVGTTAAVTTSIGPFLVLPTSATLMWLFTLSGLGYLLVRNRKRLPAFAAPILVVAVALSTSCGGNSSMSHHTTPGTPKGTYTATVTATSGNLSHNMSLQVIVQ